MPLYIYKCKNPHCSRFDMEIEWEHGMEDKDPRFCKQCTAQLVKIMAPVSVHLRGGGWGAGRRGHSIL